MLAMHDHGGNALRWWLHTAGTVTPQFNDSGLVVGPGAGTVADLRKVLDLAWEREIGIILCLWSFDMLRSSNQPTVLNRNTLLLTDTNYTRSYINNCLIPMVDSLKGHPAIIAWEIFNEPEGMSLPYPTEFGWPDMQHVPMATIQRFVNLSAGAIHRRDPSALVTNGAWSFKALTDVPAASLSKAGEMILPLSQAERLQGAKMLKEKYRSSLSIEEIIDHLEKVAGLTNYNYYSDSRLMAAGGDPAGILDFYSVHYYETIQPDNPSAISPFHHPAAYWGLNKPIVVGEFAVQNTVGVPKESLFVTLFQTGYAGAQAWSWTDSNFSSSADMLAGMQSLWDRYHDAVDVKGISGMWPIVSIISPADGTQFADSADVAITADAADSDGSIASLDFFRSDTLLIGRVTSAPYTIVWKNVLAGQYTLTAVATDNQGHTRVSNRVGVRVGTPRMTRLEAEASNRQGSGISIVSDPTASGGAYVDLKTQTGTLTWHIPNVPAAGSHDIAFGYKLFYDRPKTQYINVNGVRQVSLVFDGSSGTTWYEKTTSVNLNAGKNDIQMELYWGWMYLDYLAVPTITLATSTEETVGSPSTFTLSQNYPNPFNGISNFGFGISDLSLVTLKVYDLLGREVAVLVNEVKEPGYYVATFDARNLSSGMYVCRMTAAQKGAPGPSFQSIIRLMLLK
jgi:hypothetical protein